MPFRSESQRRFLWAKHPDIAREFADATPKGARLPEHVKNAHARGAADALERLGLKRASEELRLKIPTRTFHGFEAAHKNEAARSAKKANDLDADVLEKILEQIPVPKTPNDQTTTKDHLDRSTAWGAPSNLAVGDVGPSNDFGGV